MDHDKNCWCDKCVMARLLDRRADKLADQAAAAYIKRRGGPPGNRTVAEALREKERK